MKYEGVYGNVAMAMFNIQYSVALVRPRNTSQSIDDQGKLLLRVSSEHHTQRILQIVMIMAYCRNPVRAFDRFLVSAYRSGLNTPLNLNSNNSMMSCRLRHYAQLGLKTGHGGAPEFAQRSFSRASKAAQDAVVSRGIVVIAP